LGASSPIGLLLTLVGFLKITEDSWTTFLQSKSYVAILTKNGLGYILGDFLTYSSGRPALNTLPSIGSGVHRASKEETERKNTFPVTQ
jgi:hypothetical protein